MPSALGRAASSIEFERVAAPRLVGSKRREKIMASRDRCADGRAPGLPESQRRSRSRQARSRVAVLHAMRKTAGRRAGRAAVAASMAARCACRRESPDGVQLAGPMVQVRREAPRSLSADGFLGSHAHPRLIARCSTAELHGADSMEGVEPSTSEFRSSCASGSASTGFRRRSQHQRGTDHRTRSRRPLRSSPRRAASRWRPDFRRAQRSVRGDSNPPPCRV